MDDSRLEKVPKREPLLLVQAEPVTDFEHPRRVATAKPRPSDGNRILVEILPDTSFPMALARPGVMIVCGSGGDPDRRSEV